MEASRLKVRDDVVLWPAPSQVAALNCPCMVFARRTDDLACERLESSPWCSMQTPASFRADSANEISLKLCARAHGIQSFPRFLARI